jgi:hypothetical protein
MSYESAKALMSKSVSRPTLYKITLPESLGVGVLNFKSGVKSEISEYLSFFANRIVLPETRLDTVIALGQENMGIAREQPANMIFGKPMAVTVIENSDFSTYTALRDWMMQTTVGGRQRQGAQTQRMNYYHSFVGNIEIVKLEQPDFPTNEENKYKEPLKWTFYNAYPISIGEITLASDAYDTATTFDVNFTYESYNVLGDDDYLRQKQKTIADRVIDSLLL